MSQAPRTTSVTHMLRRIQFSFALIAAVESAII